MIKSSFLPASRASLNISLRASFASAVPSVTGKTWSIKLLPSSIVPINLTSVGTGDDMIESAG